MNTAFEVKEDGQIYVIDGYYKAMLAPRLLVSNQEVGRELIKHELKEKEFARCHTNHGSKDSPIYAVPRKEYTEVKPGIYPIPGLKWEVFDPSEKTSGYSDDNDFITYQGKVAVISLPDSDVSKKESTESPCDYPQCGCEHISHLSDCRKSESPKRNPDYVHDWDDQMTIAAGTEPKSESPENRRIGNAATVIMFLSEYIHGVNYGRRDDLNDMSLRNAKDAFNRLTNNQNEKRI